MYPKLSGTDKQHMLQAIVNWSFFEKSGSQSVMSKKTSFICLQDAVVWILSCCCTSLHRWSVWVTWELSFYTPSSFIHTVKKIQKKKTATPPFGYIKKKKAEVSFKRNLSEDAKLKPKSCIAEQLRRRSYPSSQSRNKILISHRALVGGTKPLQRNGHIWRRKWCRKQDFPLWPCSATTSVKKALSLAHSWSPLS